MNRVPLPELKQDLPSKTGLVKLPPEQAEIREATRKASARLRKELHVESLPEHTSASLHPLVRIASERLRRRDGWPENTLLRSAPKEVLNLSVTKASLGRSLGIVDVLIRTLATQGFEFEVNPNQGVTLIRWLENGTTMTFSLVEHVRRLPHVITPAEERAQKRYLGRSRWDSSVEYPTIPRYDFTATEVLAIEVGSWPSRSWKDTPRTRLEQRLSVVVAGIVDLAQQTHAKQLEDARRQEAHQRAVAHYEFLTKRHTDEVERFKQLESQATNWERAARLRQYANAVEEGAAAAGCPSAEQVDWLSWARAKADWLDPLIQVSDPILDAPEPKRPGFGWR
ncbi:conserved hypothetical protein [Cupriavidus taiwanensis]|uniref:Uncharacterized protein n=2 Tax=Cupriavidus taiwanensis TaxID=164546 RepID=A0A975WNT9_9BURK|nr:conserved hypothetical protein [Cupriavidus taiwanensis]